MYEVTVVHGAGMGKVMWSGPEIIVISALGRKKSMQYMLLEAQGGWSVSAFKILDWTYKMASSEAT